MWLRHPSNKRRAYRRLAKQQHDACLYCGVTLTEPDGTGKDGPTVRTFDHFHPRSRGGTNRIGNLVLACSDCNNAKGDMMPLNFVLSRASRP